MKKYYALYRDIREKIEDGRLRAGDRLKSKRSCADSLGVSVITVERAYSALCDEGYITARVRSGYFVSDIQPATPGKSIHAPYRPIYLPEPEENPDECDFEYSVWFSTVRKVMSERGSLLFRRAPAEGCAVLRNAISDYLYRYRDMRAQPENIIIGSGAEQLYESAAKLLGRDLVYGIEYPSYPPIECSYRSLGTIPRRLALGDDGIPERELCGIDVLHVTPYHSFPTGITVSPAGKRRYAEWAARTGGYIIEDDFDSEFFAPGHRTEPLRTLDPSGRVIYINTFSKSLSPAMRIGYMILPDGLMEKYRACPGCSSCPVPVADQYFLAEFIASGNFERHLARARRKMAQRARAHAAK